MLKIIYFLLLVFFQSLSDQCLSLLVSFGYSCTLKYPKFLTAKARYPKVPVTLEKELNILNFNFILSIWWAIIYSVFGYQATSIDHILYEFISYLEEAIFDIFVKLFIWIHFPYKLLQARFC